MSNPPQCPQCNQTDQVEKASTIYLVGINRKPLDPQDSNRIAAWLTDLPHAQLHALSKRLSPPSSGKQAPVRPIHPDMVVIVFSLVAPIFLYGILSSQPGATVPVLAVLAVFYGLYFWQRRRILTRFEGQLAIRRAADERIRKGIQRWMKLYYCARDNGLFEPGSNQITPADQINGLLLQ